MTALADRGYFNGEEMLECDEEGIRTLVPKPLTSGRPQTGVSTSATSSMTAKRDEYRCPAGNGRSGV